MEEEDIEEKILSWLIKSLRRIDCNCKIKPE